MTKLKNSKLLEGYLDRNELAEQVNKSPRTISRWSSAPDGLPYTRLGNAILYKIETFHAWLAQRESQPNRRGSA